MKKSSHLLLALKAANMYCLHGLERAALCAGAVSPDIGLCHYVKVHTYDNYWEDIKIMYCSLDKLPKHKRLYYIGKISHLLGDFYTGPHNSNVSMSLWKHILWEIHLHEFIKYSSLISLVKRENYDFVERYNEVHHEYSEYAPSVANDKFFINKELAAFYSVTLSKYLQET